MLTLALVLAGCLVQVVLRRAHLPRVAGLAVLVGATSVVLLAVATTTGGVSPGWSTASPVVVTAIVVERLWEVWDLGGWRPAVLTAGRTIGVAVAATGVLLLPPLGRLAADGPVLLAVVAAVATGVLGGYRGGRLSEQSQPLVAVLTRMRRRGRPEKPGTTGV